MSKLLILFSICHFAVSAAAQPKILPEEALPFVPAGYETLDYETGDLNNDQKTDAILLLKQKAEDTLQEDALRPMLILLRQSNGKLSMKQRHDSAILCRQCGGIFGDPYEATEIKNGSFTIRFYGGSAWRWASSYTFRYFAAAANWKLHEEEQVSYHNTDIEKTWKKFNIGESELGSIFFSQFNINRNFTEQHWRVTATRAYFYNNPRPGSKHRKGYLVKGDTIITYRTTRNFVQVSYKSAGDTYTEGFMLKSNLEKLQ